MTVVDAEVGSSGPRGWSAVELTGVRRQGDVRLVLHAPSERLARWHEEGCAAGEGGAAHHLRCDEDCQLTWRLRSSAARETSSLVRSASASERGGVAGVLIR
ncbi:hypothetical protein, partial [Streptomyces prunicolor]|uniref:hypothetical protein n=1 Tax=Streptomyces prunicolor TaxID=67348 RepID=UPI0033D9404B